MIWPFSPRRVQVPLYFLLGWAPIAFAGYLIGPSVSAVLLHYVGITLLVYSQV